MNELDQHIRKLLGLRLTPAQLTALERYETELLVWNERYNLTAIREPDKIRIKHFLDSLSCLCVMHGTPTERVIDIGTGAGFPGLPLKIVNPAMRLTLVESVGKKANFCRHVIATLGLEGVRVIQERAELVGQMAEEREQYDWAIARAVALLPVLAEYLLPLIHTNGVMLAMKGESAHAEAHSTETAFRILGGHLRKIVPVILPGVAEEHFLVVVDKVAATPQPYPRKPGLPSKRPL